MAETPKDTDQTPGDYARAVVSRLLKENITPKGSLDLGKFHQALLRQAKEDSARITATDEDKLAPHESCMADPSENGVVKLYYTAADEVLGITREQWQTGQSLACKIDDWWKNKQRTPQPAENHGITCTRSDADKESITNVLSCQVVAPTTPTSAASTHGKRRS